MEAAREHFNQYFEYWNIELPEANVKARSPGFIMKEGWSIRYTFGKESGREYIELYAMHRKTNDRHLKIYEDGESVDLDAISSVYLFDPKLPGDVERAARENHERNQRVFNELQNKGLEMMSLNTFLCMNRLPNAMR